MTGRLHRWSIGASLSRAAITQGFDVVQVAEEDYISYTGESILSRAARRARTLHRYRSYSSAVEASVRQSRPALVVVVKGDWLATDKVQRIVSLAPTVLVSLDDFFPLRENTVSRRVRASAPHYLGVFTSKQHNLSELGGLGVDKVHYLPPGVDLLVHPRVWKGDGRLWDTSFVGTYEPQRAAMLAELARTEPSIRVSVWGNSWPKHDRPTCVSGKAAYESDKSFIFANSSSALSFLRKNHRDVLTDRPFEIAASGVPLVAERSGAQSELFPEGEAALYFDSVGELAMNVKVLASDPRLASRLASAAYEVATNQTYDARFNEILRVLDSWGHAVN